MAPLFLRFEMRQVRPALVCAFHRQGSRPWKGRQLGRLEIDLGRLVVEPHILVRDAHRQCNRDIRLDQPELARGDGNARLPGLLLCAAALPLIFRAESWTVFLLAAPLLGLGVGAVTPVSNALIADIASARNLGAAMGVFGTVWDICEAAGPIVAGFLIGRLGYAPTFDLIAVVTALVAIALVALVRDPKGAGRGRR